MRTKKGMNSIWGDKLQTRYIQRLEQDFARSFGRKFPAGKFVFRNKVGQDAGIFGGGRVIFQRNHGSTLKVFRKPEIGVGHMMEAHSPADSSNADTARLGGGSGTDAQIQAQNCRKEDGYSIL